MENKNVGRLEDIVSDDDFEEYKKRADKLSTAAGATLLGSLSGMAVAASSVGLHFYSTNPVFGYIGAASFVSAFALIFISPILGSKADDYKKKADYYEQESLYFSKHI